MRWENPRTVAEHRICKMRCKSAQYESSATSGGIFQPKIFFFFFFLKDGHFRLLPPECEARVATILANWAARLISIKGNVQTLKLKDRHFRLFWLDRCGLQNLVSDQRWPKLYQTEPGSDCAKQSGDSLHCSSLEFKSCVLSAAEKPAWVLLQLQWFCEQEPGKWGTETYGWESEKAYRSGHGVVHSVNFIQVPPA